MKNKKPQPPTPTARVLSLCKKRLDSYGVSYGLVNSAQFLLNALTKQGYTCKVACVVDANAIDKEVSIFKPTHVIIHAMWVTADKLAELMTKYPKVEWVVRIHSKIPFLANEGIAFDWLCKYKALLAEFDNFVLSGNSEMFCDDISRTLDIQVALLPNVYDPVPAGSSQSKRTTKPSSEINIGCFGALRPLKNHMNQAVAAVLFADQLGQKLNFHINGTRVEQAGNQPLKNLQSFFACQSKHALVEHKWIEHPQFLDLVSTMDLGMQVSYTESFNIVACDFVHENIPIVVSPDIEWAPSLFASDPNSTTDIVAKMSVAWAGRHIGLQRLNQRALAKHNQYALDLWDNFLNAT